MTGAPPKGRTSKKRNPNGLGSLFQDKDGTWHGLVSLGKDEAGKPVRRHIHRKTRQETIDAMNQLRVAPANEPGLLRPTQGTVGAWLDEWLNDIVATYGKPATWANYEGAVRRSIMPRIGGQQLARLSERDLQELIASVSSPSGQQMVLKTIRVALAEAWRRRLVDENVANRVKIRQKPAVFGADADWEAGAHLDGRAREAIAPEDLRTVLIEIRRDRLQARWMLGLLGCRRAEVLGLVWSDLTSRGVLQLRRNRVRVTYRHGCKDSASCGSTPGGCPDRRSVGEVVRLKTSSAARDLPLGPGAIAVLQAHRERQQEERQYQAFASSKADWMFTDRSGRPLSHGTDYYLWTKLLARARLTHLYKPHELRHTAASLLGARDIDDATLMALMGWSTTRMVGNYRHPFEASMRKALEEFEGDVL